MASEADLKMEIAISQMLRAGVSLAAVVVFIGGVLYMWQAHGVSAGLSPFSRNSQPRGPHPAAPVGIAIWTVAASSGLGFCY